MRVETIIEGVKVDNRAVTSVELAELASERLESSSVLNAEIPVYRCEGLRHVIRLDADGARDVAATLGGTPINASHLDPTEFVRQGGVASARSQGTDIFASVELDGEHTLSGMAKGDKPRTSIEFTFPRSAARCSIDGNAWFEVVDNDCRHQPGMIYNGEQCFIDVGAGAEGAGLAVLFGQAAPNTGFMSQDELDPIEPYNQRMRAQMPEQKTTATADFSAELAAMRTEFDAKLAAAKAETAEARAESKTIRQEAFRTSNASVVDGWMREGRPVQNGAKVLEVRSQMAALGALTLFDEFVGQCLAPNPQLATGQRSTIDMSTPAVGNDNSPKALEAATRAKMAADGSDDYITALSSVMRERGLG